MSAGETKQKYGTILTATGKAAFADAVATNTLVDIQYIALGDGGGSEYYPDESQTTLKNQVYQMPVNSVYVDPDNANWIVVEGMMPESAGGFNIREAAIKTAGEVVIAVGSYPTSYKPMLEEGSAVGIGFKFIFEVTNADVVNMNIDPSTIYATIQYVNNSVDNHAEETSAHGGTYGVFPLRLMLRNKDGRCQVKAPVEDEDAANKEWAEEQIARCGGIKPWDEKTIYDPLPHIVWGSDNMIYIAEKPSGSGVVDVGPKDPTTTTGYWVALPAFLGAGDTDIDDGRDNYPGRFKAFETSASRPGWRYANGQKVTSAGVVAPELCRRFKNLTPQEREELLLTEEQWQALSAERGGCGLVPKFVFNEAEDWIRLPDMRGTYDEPAGFNGRKVGDSHSDGLQNITGEFWGQRLSIGSTGSGAFGAAFVGTQRPALSSSSHAGSDGFSFDASRVARTSVATEPRARNTYGCVYIGLPAVTRMARTLSTKMSRAVALFDSNGYSIGADTDHGEGLPHNATYTLPEMLDGFVPRWNGEAWEQVENHKGMKGYVNGEYTVIKEYGPLPEGFTEEYVDPRSPEEIRAEKITVRLAELNRLKIDPLSARFSGMSTPEEDALLVELVTETKTLRVELAALTAQTNSPAGE